MPVAAIQILGGFAIGLGAAKHRETIERIARSSTALLGQGAMRVDVLRTARINVAAAGIKRRHMTGWLNLGASEKIVTKTMAPMIF